MGDQKYFYLISNERIKKELSLQSTINVLKKTVS